MNLFDKGKIAIEFKKGSAKIGIEIPSKIPTAKTTFETYMQKLCSNPLTINELKDAFFSLKVNNSPGYDETSFEVVKKCFVEKTIQSFKIYI